MNKILLISIFSLNVFAGKFENHSVMNLGYGLSESGSVKKIGIGYAQGDFELGLDVLNYNSYKEVDTSLSLKYFNAYQIAQTYVGIALDTNKDFKLSPRGFIGAEFPAGEKMAYYVESGHSFLNKSYLLTGFIFDI